MEKFEGWVNLYKEVDPFPRALYPTKRDADNWAEWLSAESHTRIACIHLKEVGRIEELETEKKGDQETPGTPGTPGTP